MGEQALSNDTYEAYLALEAKLEIKYEYHDGYIVAMAGGSPEHGLIAGNFIGAVNRALQAGAKISSEIAMRDIYRLVPDI